MSDFDWGADAGGAVLPLPPQPSDEAPTEQEQQGRSPRPRPSRRGPNTAAAKRAMEKLLAVQRATDEERATAAAVLGVSEADQVKLALACLSASRSSVGDPAADIVSVAEAADPLEAMERAVTLAGERPQRFAAATRMLRAVDPDLGSVPPQPGKAARVFVESVRRLSDDQLRRLAVPELIG